MSHRIIFMNINTLNLNMRSKYICGAEVGGKNRSVSRALKRRSNNTAQGKPCCDSNYYLNNYILVTGNVQFKGGNNLLTIFVDTFSGSVDPSKIKTVDITDNYGYIKASTGYDVINEIGIQSGPPGLGYFIVNHTFTTPSPSSGTGIIPITIGLITYESFSANFKIYLK